MESISIFLLRSDSLQSCLSALCGPRVGAVFNGPENTKPKAKNQNNKKANALTGFCACHDFYIHVYEMETTITTVRAAGEAFAELDTIVVVAHILSAYNVLLSL